MLFASPQDLHPSNADVVLKTVRVGLSYRFSSQSTAVASWDGWPGFTAAEMKGYFWFQELKPVDGFAHTPEFSTTPDISSSCLSLHPFEDGFITFTHSFKSVATISWRFFFIQTPFLSTSFTSFNFHHGASWFGKWTSSSCSSASQHSACSWLCWWTWVSPLLSRPNASCPFLTKSEDVCLCQCVSLQTGAVARSLLSRLSVCGGVGPILVRLYFHTCFLTRSFAVILQFICTFPTKALSSARDRIHLFPL